MNISNPTPRIVVPRGIDAEKLAQLTVEVIRLKMMYCRSRKTKSILRKACQILQTDDDVYWYARRYSSTVTQTDFVELDAARPSIKVEKSIQTTENEMLKEEKHDKPLMVDTAVQTSAPMMKSTVVDWKLDAKKTSSSVLVQTSAPMNKSMVVDLKLDTNSYVPVQNCLPVLESSVADVGKTSSRKKRRGRPALRGTSSYDQLLEKIDVRVAMASRKRAHDAKGNSPRSARSHVRKESSDLYSEDELSPGF